MAMQAAARGHDAMCGQAWSSLKEDWAPVLNYSSLFTDLEARFRSAGRDPASYRRMAAEVGRAAQDLRDYMGEVAADYVARLERRLAQPGAGLTPEERGLVRAALGLPPEDPELDRALVEDLARLEESVAALAPLRDVPLSLRNVEALRRLLARMEGVLPRIVDALEAREGARRFDEAVGRGGEVHDREWLLVALRAARGEAPSS
ncbi:MAG: hypothetical protein M9894_18310 [Planctomycetes bacterium]|nr:hypothetical protein [Planctomycetota bacterium]